MSSEAEAAAGFLDLVILLLSGTYTLFLSLQQEAAIIIATNLHMHMDSNSHHMHRVNKCKAYLTDQTMLAVRLLESGRAK